MKHSEIEVRPIRAKKGYEAYLPPFRSGERGKTRNRL